MIVARHQCPAQDLDEFFGDLGEDLGLDGLYVEYRRTERLREVRE